MQKLLTGQERLPREVNMTDEEFFKMIGRHCVAIVWQDKLKEENKPSGGIAFSAFVISIAGRWLLVTAGHIVEQLLERQQAGRSFVGAGIFDAWTLRPLTKAGFMLPDINDAYRGHRYSDDLGVDYAWFELRDHHVELLKSNGIVPLSEATWENLPSPAEFVGFNCFGFPSDINVERRDANGVFEGMKLKPRLIPYTPATPHDDLTKTKFPRLFYMPSGTPDGSVPELDGMSGGPVFGYSKVGDDLRNLAPWSTEWPGQQSAASCDCLSLLAARQGDCPRNTKRCKMKLKSFDDAIGECSKKPHVLLGNGFSRALRDNIFAYSRLFDRAKAKLSPTAQKAFEKLGTTNFEQVMRASVMRRLWWRFIRKRNRQPPPR